MPKASDNPSLSLFDPPPASAPAPAKAAQTAAPAVSAPPTPKASQSASPAVSAPKAPEAVSSAASAPPTAKAPQAATPAVGTPPANATQASPPAAPVQVERDVYTVARLNREVRMLLEQRIPLVWLEGELSNFSSPASGHWYFSLKDRDAQIRCAMFRMKNTSVGFTPKSGQHVLVRGRVTMYEARGDYQLIVEHLEEAGIGALKREFERLKAKLAAEGLFAVERKRPLPKFPRRIGVITSPSGAAIRDVLHILARRFPPASVVIYPTPVQGEVAIPSIIRALAVANARAECDVLIVARGGGSIEDLWAFNDEGVARAIRASALPVVSGIGHEIDFTIADFVADARAPTPSGAAELVVPDRRACLDVLARTADRLVVAMRRELRVVGTRFDAASARLKMMHPGARLQQQEQRLDDLEQRLVGAMRSSLHHSRSRMSEAVSTLLHQSPERRVKDMCLKYESLAARLQHAWANRSARAEHRLSLAARALNTVSPLATLERGFAIVTRGADDRLITDVGSVQIGEEIRTRVARGELRATVTSKKEPGSE
jgi:exodeoxyribonuclease VII large subunit